MSKGPRVRFAVIDPLTQRHSGVWRVWTSRDDVYIAAEDQGGVLKVSLHPGRYRVAFTSEHWATGEEPNNAPGPGRHIISYEPSEAIDGVEHAWMLGFQLDALHHRNSLPEGIVRISPADSEVMVQVDVWICDPEVSARPEDPLPPSPLALAGGRLVWVASKIYEAGAEDGFTIGRRDYPASFLQFSERSGAADPPGLVLRPLDIR